MSNGLITPFTIDSSYLARIVKIGIYFPNEFSPFVEHTLFLCFDGQDVSQIGQIHRKYERLVEDAIDPAVFVFIHYTNVTQRSNEYHPEGVDRKKYQSFIVKELLPYLESAFHITHTKERTILIGDSLAASISLTLTLEQPDLSSKAVLFSPMVTNNIIKQINYLDKEVKEALDYYVVVGNKEDNFELLTGGFADFLNPIREFHHVLTAKSIHHYYEEINGGHNWKTWKPQIEKSLNYYLN
ncbi:alpha/beta hydrolase [Macrococcus animalis]|uniref:alpha/beta hydrolase n=1 Tax=Macrococcus animalis TaxID=3395467 RepID=UPI0039BE285D